MVSTYHGCKGEAIKYDMILYDRDIIQDCKTITFEKIADHTKYKKPNVPSHLHIFRLDFVKQIIVLSIPFAVGGKKFSKECCLGE